MIDAEARLPLLDANRSKMATVAAITEGVGGSSSSEIPTEIALLAKTIFAIE